MTSVCSLWPLIALKWFTLSKMVLLKTDLHLFPTCCKHETHNPFGLWHVIWWLFSWRFRFCNHIDNGASGEWVSTVVVARWFGRFHLIEMIWRVKHVCEVVSPTIDWDSWRFQLKNYDSVCDLYHLMVIVNPSDQLFRFEDVVDSIYSIWGTISPTLIDQFEI